MTRFFRNRLLTSILIISNVFLAISVLANEFYFNTKNGFGIMGSVDSINYKIGFPYSEIGFKIPLDGGKSIFISTYGGYDFNNSTYFLKVSPDFVFNSFSISTAFEFASKSIITDEATETGRFNAGLDVTYRFEDLIFQAVAYNSVFYLYYDPAFNLNIPTIFTDNIFRSSLDIRISYVQPTYSISIGYYAVLRWLSYRSSFITGENTGYIEGKFKIKF